MKERDFRRRSAGEKEILSPPWQHFRDSDIGTLEVLTAGKQSPALGREEGEKKSPIKEWEVIYG